MLARFFSFAFCLMATSLISSTVFGQANSDLIPPASNAGFELVCAELTEDGQLEIVRSHASYENLKIDRPKLKQGGGLREEKVVQKQIDLEAGGVFEVDYEVKVPMTHMALVDGKQVPATSYQVVSRKREVRVDDLRGSKLVEFQIPKVASRTVRNNGGFVELSVMVSEVSKRVVANDEEVVKVTRTKKLQVDPASVKCYDVKGILLTSEQTKEKLLGRCPALLIFQDKPFDEYFTALLNPDALLIYDKENAISRASMYMEEK